MSRAQAVTLEQYFAGSDERSRALFDVVRSAIASVGPADMRVTKSQVAFRNRLAFAWTWMPAQYVHGKVAPLVLTIDLHRRDSSPRWKQVVEPRPGLFTHHLEIHSAEDVDDEVLGFLREAWAEAV
jgi:Domain of unknown function (DUF5655)